MKVLREAELAGRLVQIPVKALWATLPLVCLGTGLLLLEFGSRIESA